MNRTVAINSGLILKPIPGIVVLFLFLTVHSFCQENGYIITKENEFKGGEIKFTNSKFTSVRFAEFNSENFVEYSADELLEYGFHKGRIFPSRRVTIVDNGNVITQSMFLEVLVNDKLNLYRVKYSGRNYFFIDKGDFRLIPVNGDPEKAKDNYRGILSRYMSDCNEVQYAIEYGKLNKPYLETLVKRYNSCDDKIVPQLRVGIYTGINLSNIVFAKSKLDITSLTEPQFPLAISPQVGLFLDLPMERGWSVHMEVGYGGANYKAETKTTTGTDVLKEDVRVKLGMGDFVVSLKYSSLKPGIRPYVHGGAGLAYAFGCSNEVERYQKTDSTEITETFDWSTEATSKAYFEIILGAGVEFFLWKKYPVFFEARIEQFMANDPPTPDLTNFGLVVGVGF
jgi:hypothetical protein